MFRRTDLCHLKRGEGSGFGGEKKKAVPYSVVSSRLGDDTREVGGEEAAEEPAEKAGPI